MTLSVLYCLAAGSAITDILKNKIFNAWLLIGALAGVMMSFLDKEMNISIKEMGIKMLITFLILIPVYMVKGIGAGDLKLLTVISLFLPTGELICCMIMSFVIGALFGIIKIIVKGKMRQTIHFAVPVLIAVLLVTGENALVCM